MFGWKNNGEMSLAVVLRSCVNLRGKCDRLARITFRGKWYFRRINVDPTDRAKKFATSNVSKLISKFSRCFCTIFVSFRKFYAIFRLYLTDINWLTNIKYLSSKYSFNFELSASFIMFYAWIFYTNMLTFSMLVWLKRLIRIMLCRNITAIRLLEGSTIF